MLIYDPDLRISARKALKHNFFKPIRDLEKKNENTHTLATMIPQFAQYMPESTTHTKNLYIGLAIFLVMIQP